MNQQYAIVVYDPSGYHEFNVLDWWPDISHIERVGFMMFNGSIREVRDVHRTKSGIQIELYKLFYIN